MGIKYVNARDGALKDFSLVVHRTGTGVLEQVFWLLWELVGRNCFSTFVFLYIYFIVCKSKLEVSRITKSSNGF